MLSVVCWKWGGKYSPDHVLRLRSAVARNLRLAHRFLCVTDDPSGLDGVDLVPMPDDHARLRLTKQYRRVRIHDAAFAASLGPRILQVDLDAVVTGDITPLARRPEPFAIWRSPAYGRREWMLNTSLMLTDAGYLDDLWRAFSEDWGRLDTDKRHRNYMGSDQALVEMWLDDRRLPHGTFGAADGVYSWRGHVAPPPLPRGHPRPTGGALPDGARFVGFWGPCDPASPECQAAAPWILEHWK